MKKVEHTTRPINVAARALREGQFRHKIVPDKKKYARKGRASSTRKFEDSIQLAKSFVSWSNH